MQKSKPRFGDKAGRGAEVDVADATAQVGPIAHQTSEKNILGSDVSDDKDMQQKATGHNHFAQQKLKGKRKRKRVVVEEQE